MATMKLAAIASASANGRSLTHSRTHSKARMTAPKPTMTAKIDEPA